MLFDQFPPLRRDVERCIRSIYKCEIDEILQEFSTLDVEIFKKVEGDSDYILVDLLISAYEQNSQSSVFGDVYNARLAEYFLEQSKESVRELIANNLGTKLSTVLSFAYGYYSDSMYLPMYDRKTKVFDIANESFDSDEEGFYRYYAEFKRGRHSSVSVFVLEAERAEFEEYGLDTMLSTYYYDYYRGEGEFGTNTVMQLTEADFRPVEWSMTDDEHYVSLKGVRKCKESIAIQPEERGI